MSKCSSIPLIHVEIHESLGIVRFYFSRNLVQPLLEPWLWRGGYQDALISLERNIPFNTYMDVGYVPQLWVAVEIIKNTSIKGFIGIHRICSHSSILSLLSLAMWGRHGLPVS